MMGMRPVMELMFLDFITVAMTVLVNTAAKARFMLGGKVSVPMGLRAPTGVGTGSAAQHSQCLESWFVATPGIKGGGACHTL
jgi:pyruvate dehydrogenase E1 component beta subunit